MTLLQALFKCTMVVSQAPRLEPGWRLLSVQRSVCFSLQSNSPKTHVQQFFCRWSSLRQVLWSCVSLFCSKTTEQAKRHVNHTEQSSPPATATASTFNNSLLLCRRIASARPCTAGQGAGKLVSANDHQRQVADLCK